MCVCALDSTHCSGELEDEKNKTTSFGGCFSGKGGKGCCCSLEGYSIRRVLGDVSSRVSGKDKGLRLVRLLQ